MGVRLRATAGFCVLIGLVGGAAVTMQAGQAMPRSQTRAANLARMRAESLNGGIAQYRADRCMYTTGAPACLLKTTTETYVFRFRGGPPGWQQQTGREPTVLTTVTVSRDGQTIRAVSNTPVATR